MKNLILSTIAASSLLAFAGCASDSNELPSSSTTTTTTEERTMPTPAASTTTETTTSSSVHSSGQ